MRFAFGQILALPPRIPPNRYKVRNPYLQKSGPRGPTCTQEGAKLVTYYALRNQVVVSHFIYSFLFPPSLKNTYTYTYVYISSRLDLNSLSFHFGIYCLTINDAFARRLWPVLGFAPPGAPDVSGPANLRQVPSSPRRLGPGLWGLRGGSPGQGWMKP